MRRFLTLLVLSAVPATALAQGTFETSGRISTGVQQVENNTNSSKFAEYRDLRDNRYPFGFQFNALNPQGIFLDAAGSNISRRDQSFKLVGGDLGVWSFAASWDELPHNFSNKALSPYTSTTPGALDVPTTMAITLKKLATVAADAPNVVAQDAIIAAYAQQYSQPIALENQTKVGAATLKFNPLEALDLSVGYALRKKTGSHLSYGSIGDRPPRTLNIQLAEPVDYTTGDLRVAAEYNAGAVQTRFEYLVSDFSNDIDVLTWRNVYASPAAGATFDTWDRQVAAYGRRPLAPDNQYQSGTFTGGANLPFDSRLTASVSYGRMEQNQALVPYAWHADALANSTLPRATADALMKTIAYSAEYAIAPAQALNLRAFFRSYDLDNETPASNWQYVTQDASNLNGSVSYKNKRVSVAYGFARQNVGIDGTYRLGFWQSSVGFGFEKEDIDREFREANTSETILRASWRARPVSWLSLRAKYLRGDRDADGYNSGVVSQTYWYAPADAGTDNDNPQFTFNDHPDMRRYDVSDKKRDQFDITAGLNPGGALSVSTTFRYRKDDYDSDVTSTQPLINTALADREASTPGDQLGLLNAERKTVGVDLFYAPAERFTLNASLGYDAGTSDTRSIEFNENNKQNPSAVQNAELGPWTRAGSQWTADFDDRVTYAGIGGTYDVVPNRITLAANYTLSLSKMDIEYAGFGVTNWDGTPFPDNHQFAFTTPETVKNNSHIADVSIDFPVLRSVGAKLGWQYESYQIRDWQQSAGTAQFESVGSDLLLRDTSRSHQWGNRLFNVGSYLAPSFTGHALYASLTYSFGAQRLTQ